MFPLTFEASEDLTVSQFGMRAVEFSQLFAEIRVGVKRWILCPLTDVHAKTNEIVEIVGGSPFFRRAPPKLPVNLVPPVGCDVDSPSHPGTDGQEHLLFNGFFDHVVVLSLESALRF